MHAWGNEREKEKETERERERKREREREKTRHKLFVPLSMPLTATTLTGPWFVFLGNSPDPEVSQLFLINLFMFSISVNVMPLIVGLHGRSILYPRKDTY